jgi:hypothetical protein
MKTKSILIAMVVLVYSCEKTTCTTCGLTELNSGLTASKTFCGTSEEIAKESNRLKNEATVLTLENPGEKYTGGCE